MKQILRARRGLWLGITCGILALVGSVAGFLAPPPADAQDQSAANATAAKIPALDPQKVNERLPGQSHEMEEAGYHFDNLWFAGDKQNWPLAGYYLRKTSSYLELAVQIKPVRKTTAGTEVDLKGILSAVNSGLIGQLDKAIRDKNAVNFKAAYRQTIEGCNACHSACERSYIRVQAPAAPSAPFIDFDPPTSGRQ